MTQYSRLDSSAFTPGRKNPDVEKIAEVEGALEVQLSPDSFQGALSWGSKEMGDLIDGEEELLVSYECWYEKHVLREGERVGDIEIRYSPGVVLEVEAGKVRNARLTNASGDSVLYYEGMEVAIVAVDGKIPLRVAVDGTVRLSSSGEYKAIGERITPSLLPMLESAAAANL